MSKQPEQILEEQLVEQLQKLNYSLVHIKDEKELIANLKHQLEKHNNIKFSHTEFEKVLNIHPNGELEEPNLDQDWNKSHIIHSNFRVYRPKVFREFIPSLRDKQLSQGGGFTYITEEQYKDIVRK